MLQVVAWDARNGLRPWLRPSEIDDRADHRYHEHAQDRADHDGQQRHARAALGLDLWPTSGLAGARGTLRSGLARHDSVEYRPDLSGLGRRLPPPLDRGLKPIGRRFPVA